MSGRPDSLTSSNLLRGDRAHLTALTMDDLPAIVCWYEDTAFRQ
jgi:hypothetical protein